MITNASDKSIEFSANPNVEDALSGWLRKLIIGKISKSIVDYKLEEYREIYEVFAVRQPMATKRLSILPEGQRAWQLETLHIKGSQVEFCLDDQVIIDNKKYRILQKFEWQDRGYVEYGLTEDWGQIFESSISESVSLQEVKSDS